MSVNKKKKNASKEKDKDRGKLLQEVQSKMSSLSLQGNLHALYTL